MLPKTLAVLFNRFITDRIFAFGHYQPADFDLRAALPAGIQRRRLQKE
jgi:hypothetical protein